MREIIAGTGGVDLGAPGVTFPGTQSFDGTHFGILELTLHPTGYDWRFVADDGTVGDTGSDACVTAPPGGPSLSQHVMAKGGGAVTPGRHLAGPHRRQRPPGGRDRMGGNGQPHRARGMDLGEEGRWDRDLLSSERPAAVGIGDVRRIQDRHVGPEPHGVERSRAHERARPDASGTSGNTATPTASSGTTQPTSQPVEIAIAAIRTLKASTQSSPTNGFSQVDVGTQGSNTTGFYAKVTSSAGPQGVSVTLGGTAKWRGITATYRGS